MAICKGCGRTFTPKRRSQKYCSDTCRGKYYAEHYFAKTEVMKVCLNCGTSFTTTKPLKQAYCTPECRVEAAKKRIEGIAAQYVAERATFLSERYAAFAEDGFRCTVCGRGISEGVTLDVVEEKGKLKTICAECKEGRRLAEGEEND